MRILFLLVLLGFLGGCSSFEYHSIDEEVAKEAKLNAAKLALNKQLKQHYDAGEKFYREDDLDMAEAEFKAMLKIKPEEENALYRLGNIAYKRGKFELSAEYFERTIKADPRNAKAHYNLATIRLMQAQNHFKYYAALADQNANLSKVSQLLADIDKFAGHDQPADNSKVLDQLAGALKK